VFHSKSSRQDIEPTLQHEGKNKTGTKLTIVSYIVVLFHVCISSGFTMTQVALPHLLSQDHRCMSMWATITNLCHHWPIAKREHNDIRCDLRQIFQCSHKSRVSAVPVWMQAWVQDHRDYDTADFLTSSSPSSSSSLPLSLIPQYHSRWHRSSQYLLPSSSMPPPSRKTSTQITTSKEIPPATALPGVSPKPSRIAF